MHHKERRPGIYLLPNLFTTASLFCAFYSIVASMKGLYDSAAIAIYSGMLADILDGRIARLTQTQTSFGAEYDSLSDMVTFGLAPSLLAYHAYLQQLGKVGWLIAFIYTASVALRLARFNTQVGKADKNYFQGLACPAAAAIIASFAWICQGLAPHLVITLTCAALMLCSSVLMVSNIRYYSFKQLDFKGKIPFLYLLFIVILFVAIAANPAVVLLISFLIYACSGPTQTLIQLHRMRKIRKQLRQRKGSKDKSS